MTNPSPQRPPDLPGLRHAFGFAVFNALSYQIVLGSPMILYAKSLGAGATVLGVVAGMMPLLVIFQIPAASHVPRLGYRRFMVSGWSLRVMFIFLMAMVPLTSGFLREMGRLSLLLLLLFGFNLSRGISSAAWLPWITNLVPGESRGWYLARESACANLASAVTLLLAAATLGEQPAAWQYAATFLFSASMGALSLWFLRRIPDTPCVETESRSREPVPWRAIAAHPPFRKLLRLNVAWSVAYGGMTAFTVAYLKVFAGMSSGWILAATAISSLGGLGGLVLFGSRLDRHGSRPVLLLCVIGWMAVAGLWAMIAGGWMRPGLGVVIALQVAMGLGYAVFSMANTRLAMAVAPAMGRSHFFALFSVVSNLTLGISPVLWGLLIDGWADRTLGVGGFEVNRYSLFYLLATVAFGVTLGLSRRLDEPTAGRLPHLIQDLLARRPLRGWMRLWPR
ncbi:MAG: MFS transporter [Verrucomicrobiales bacterium]|nr:MFS transporter [Verrucomicrobiales bacterium]